MSRGFVNEDDQEEIPIVPPRADLPSGTTNYVTQIGLDKLHEEQQSLLSEKEHLDIDSENEKRIAINYINAKLNLLNERITSAVVVDLRKQKQDEVRFGAMVTLKIGNDPKHHTYQIVGVDEANFKEKKISFISPIANVLIGKKMGEKAILTLAKEERVFEILDISY